MVKKVWEILFTLPSGKERVLKRFKKICIQEACFVDYHQYRKFLPILIQRTVGLDYLQGPPAFQFFKSA